MTRLEELKQQIENLSREDFAEFRDWFCEQDSIAWDAQIEGDAKSGRLAALHRRPTADGNLDPSLLDAEWLKEAEDRLAAYHSGELAAVDAEQVFDENLLTTHS